VIGWAATIRDSASRPPRALAAAGAKSACARCPLRAAQLPVPAVRPLNKQFTLAFNGELGWGKGLATGRSRCSRTSIRAAWVRCAASTRARWARGRDRLADRRPRKITLNAEIITPFPAPATTDAAHVRFRRRGNVFGENEKFA
jgi:outer membrane protein insertion porin family